MSRDLSKYEQDEIIARVSWLVLFVSVYNLVLCMHSLWYPLCCEMMLEYSSIFIVVMSISVPFVKSLTMWQQVTIINYACTLACLCLFRLCLDLFRWLIFLLTSYMSRHSSFKPNRKNISAIPIITKITTTTISSRVGVMIIIPTEGAKSWWCPEKPLSQVSVFECLVCFGCWFLVLKSHYLACWWLLYKAHGIVAD